MYVLETLGIWNEGYKETKDEIIVDPTLDNAADMLLAYSSATDDINMGQSIVARLELKIEEAQRV